MRLLYRGKEGPERIHDQRPEHHEERQRQQGERPDQHQPQRLEPQQPPRSLLDEAVGAIEPDPQRFDPSRFVGKKVDPSTYFPFGGGARRCLGMAFANYEMKIVLATILARAELTSAKGKRVRLVRRGITFAPSGGVPVVVTARRASA